MSTASMGKRSRIWSLSEILAIELDTNRQTPRGGVHIPMVRLTAMIMPK